MQRVCRNASHLYLFIYKEYSMERTYLDSWKQYLNEAVEWRDGDLSIKVAPDSSDADYHNIWLSNTTTKTTYVWQVYADPDLPLVPDIRIDVKSIDESTKKLSYRYKHPTKGWTTGSNTINDTDWNKVKTKYKVSVPGTTITFKRGTWKKDGKPVEADYVVYLNFKKKFNY